MNILTRRHPAATDRQGQRHKSPLAAETVRGLDDEWNMRCNVYRSQDALPANGGVKMAFSTATTAVYKGFLTSVRRTDMSFSFRFI